ncbi:DUF397 domain-containing protein [Actinomadura harenae]|uniref:DUF397 domain-containing protein n=1 Tax=Actinomadura harenae TaxID=2483351 RepID=A0A3M2LNQ4_9ACTN|nr:DUF397 domain-containing protein [Actinomadura harenae]RMI39059.1 DUF397 domain-containing protein [Actinomadura harenae]
MMHWRKSTYSGGNNANCVEMRRLAADAIGVRDSKNPDAGHITVSAEVLRTALASYRSPEGRNA